MNHQLEVEVTQVSLHGVWLRFGEKERFLRYEQFPWLRKAPFDQGSNDERPTRNYLYWPHLEFDLSVESFPLSDSFPRASGATHF